MSWCPDPTLESPAGFPAHWHCMCDQASLSNVHSSGAVQKNLKVILSGCLVDWNKKLTKEQNDKSKRKAKTRLRAGFCDLVLKFHVLWEAWDQLE